jgi:hypothetical protein
MQISRKYNWTGSGINHDYCETRSPAGNAGWPASNDLHPGIHQHLRLIDAAARERPHMSSIYFQKNPLNFSNDQQNT